MRICIHHDVDQKCIDVQGPLVLEQLERATAFMFNLQFSRFVLSYRDDDNSNILMPEQADLDIFVERINGCKSCDLYIVCEKKDLFDPNKEEFLKRLYLSEFKRCARDSEGNFNLEAAVDAMRAELTAGGMPENLITQIVNYVMNSYELSEIEAEMSISARDLDEECEKQTSCIKVGAIEGEVSISSISEPEYSKKSFFTDNENKGVRKLGLETERLKYLNDLSVIREDTNSHIQDADFGDGSSEDEEMKPNWKRTQQGRHFTGRHSDFEISREGGNDETSLYPPTIEKPAFASEIVNRPSAMPKLSIASKIKGMFSSFKSKLFGRNKKLSKKET